jgi:RNA polymerase sigma factor (sigma-70 family)
VHPAESTGRPWSTESSPRVDGATPVGSVRAVVVGRKVRRRFRDGDPEAVRAVYRCYGRLVYAVAYRVLGDRGLTEEATQQAFLQAWRAAESLDEGREMGPWLATIARRVAIDVYRGEARRSADQLESVAPGDPALVTQPQSAEAVYDAWEVRRAVAELPPEEQEIVRLQHFEGLTHTQIAERLKLAPGTVKSRSFRAHKRLASQLGHLRE